MKMYSTPTTPTTATRLFSAKKSLVVLAAISMILLVLLSVPIIAHAATSTSELSVQTFSGDINHQIFGYYVTLWQNGTFVSSCFSTCAFTVNNGQHYQFAVSDYGSCSF